MANLKDTIIAGMLRVTGTIFGNLQGTIDGFTVAKSVPSDAKFTDTVTTVTTSGSGNAVTALSASNGAITATKGSTFLTSHQTIKQDGITGATVNRYATCSTDAGTAAKVATITSGTFKLETGASVYVFFTATNTVANPTLNVNNTGAKSIKRYGSVAVGTTTDTSWLAESFVHVVYNGTNWYIAEGNNNVYKANTIKLVTSTVPNVTAVGSVPSLSYTARSVGSASGWSAGSASSYSVSGGVLTLTPSTVPSLTITSTACDDITAWSAGSVPTLGTAITVATGSTSSSGSGATVATGIATN